MSSYDGGGFDEWVEDSLYGPVSPAQLAAVRHLLEPFRETIELQLEGFEPDEMSWRTFRNALWGSIPADVDAQVGALLRGDLLPSAVLDDYERARIADDYGALVRPNAHG